MKLVFNPFTSSLDYVASNLLDVGVTSATAQYQVLTTGATPFAPLFSGWLLDGTTGGKTVLAITSAKTLTLTATDNFNLTIPATGTAALLATANVFTTQQMVDGTSDQIQLRVQGHSTQTTSLTEWQNSSGTVLVSVEPDGDVNILSTNQSFATLDANALYVAGGIAAPLIIGGGLSGLMATGRGVAYDFKTDGTQTGATPNYTGAMYLTLAGTGNTGFNSANYARLQTSNSSSFSFAMVNLSRLVHAGSGTISDATNLDLGGFVSGGGILVRYSGVRVQTPSITSGSITTAYGLLVENISGATNNFAIYTGTGLNRLGDQLKIDMAADRIGFILQAHSTQTTNLFETQTSAAAIVNSMSLTAGAVFNEQGTDVIDFRVESDTLDAIFVDSSADTVALKGGQIRSYVAKTANYTLTLKDYACDVTANTINITLPTAVGCTGQIYHVNNSGTGVVTILTTSSQTINGAASQLVYQYESIALMSNNANWIIL